mgnify:CR=1 FL=1
MSDIAFGFDPSLTHFGFAVADVDDGCRFLDVGVWVTKPDSDDGSKTSGYARRCEFLAAKLFGLERTWGRPALLACEAVALPFGRTSMQTISAMGRVRGLVDALAASQSLTVVEFQPARLKAFVTGDCQASKDTVIAAMRHAHPELSPLFAELKFADIEHAADAAAVLHAALTPR